MKLNFTNFTYIPSQKKHPVYIYQKYFMKILIGVEIEHFNGHNLSSCLLIIFNKDITRSTKSYNIIKFPQKMVHFP